MLSYKSIVKIEDYTGGGTDSPDNTAALNLAVKDLDPQKGGTILFGVGTYNFTSDPAIFRSGVRLKGEGASTRLKFTSAQSGVNFLDWYGRVGYQLALAAAVKKEDTEITVAEPLTAAAGDLIYIFRNRAVPTPWNSVRNPTDICYSVILRVLAVDGNKITFDGRIPFDIFPSDKNHPPDEDGNPIVGLGIYQLLPLVGGGAEDLVLDGWDATGTNIRAINTTYTSQQYFNNVRFEGWRSRPEAVTPPAEEAASGLFMWVGYENVVGNVSSYMSGSHPWADLHIGRQTALRMGQIRSEQPRFGILIMQCSYSVIDSFIVTASAVRGVKLAGCCRCTVNSAVLDNINNTGFCLAWGSQDNVIGNLCISATAAQGVDEKGNKRQSVGLWASASYNCNNLFGQVRLDNTWGRTIEFYESDTGNVIGQVLYNGKDLDTDLEFYNAGGAIIGAINGKVPAGHQFGSLLAPNTPATANTANLVLYRSPYVEGAWSGIACGSGGEIQIITGSQARSASVKAMLTTQELAANATGLYLEFNNGTSLVVKKVEAGDPHSGGNGYRMLRITN